MPIHSEGIAPTDDEQEAVDRIVFDLLRYTFTDAVTERLAGDLLTRLHAAGFRRSEVPETSAEREMTPCGNLVCTGCRVCGCPALGIAPAASAPQGEPSDVSVDAAIRAFHAATFGAGDDAFLTPERLATMREPWRAPAPPRRQAMILDFADGHREYSPEVEVAGTPGDVTITPIVPFRRIPEGERPHD